MRTLLFSLLVTVFFCANSQAGDHAGIWRLGAVEQYPLNGVLSDILRAAYSRAGLDFELSEWPSPRSVQLANQGTLDAELARIERIGELYPNLLKVPVLLMTFQIVAITADPDLAGTSLTALNQYRLGISPGMPLYEQIDLPSDEAFQPSTAQQLLRMTQARRVDFALIPATLAKEWQQSSSKTLYILPGELATFRIYHFIHRKHADKLDALTKALQEVKDSGQIERMLNDFLRGEKMF